MKFPIDVIKIFGQTYLIQGQITEEFKKQLYSVNRNIRNAPNGIRIQSNSYPELTEESIFINGDNENRSYKIVCTRDYCRPFQEYKDTINFYKEVMGYE